MRGWRNLMSFTVALDPNNSPAKNKLEIEKALSGFDGSGGEIRLPRSKEPFPCDPGIVWPTQKNITLIGEGRADAYEASYAGTKLKFTAGTTAFDFSSFLPFSGSGPHAAIENIAFDGDRVCNFGLKVYGNVSLKHLHVTKFNTVGIHYADWINSSSMEHISTVGNDGHGVLIGGYGALKNTPFSMRWLRSRSNGGIGLVLRNAMHFSGYDGIIESNAGGGIDIYRPASTNLIGCALHEYWLENNLLGAAGYSLTIDGDAPPELFRFIGGGISAGSLTKAALINNADTVLFDSVEFTGSGHVDIGPNASAIGFLDCRGHVLNGNTAATWDKSRMQLATGSSGGGGGGPTVAFHAHKGGANQTVQANNTEKVTFPVEVFDTNSNFANSRFTPTVAGPYAISASVKAAVNSHCRVFIYRNGQYLMEATIYGNGSPTATATATIWMNGSTDYLEVYAVCASGTTIYGGAGDTYFSGALVG